MVGSPPDPHIYVWVGRVRGYPFYEGPYSRSSGEYWLKYFEGGRT